MHTDGTLLLISSLLGWFGKAYTSTYVLDETLTLAKARIGGREAVDLSEKILESEKIVMLGVEERAEILSDALGKFKKYSDLKGLSFTDCTTLSLRENHAIHYLMSFERNFKPLVPRLLGEDYHRTLSENQKQMLATVAKKLGIKLKLS